MKAKALFGLLLLLSFSGKAQDCSCADNYKWLKETFEQNDAGFQYVIDQKGEQEYQKHCAAFSAKVDTIQDQALCAETLMDWLLFFRKAHIWIGINEEENTAGQSTIDGSKIKAQYKDWETYAFKEKEFNAYISKIEVPGLEGIWESPPYKFGIKKVNDTYIGFILEADGIYWSKSQVKFKITEENGALTATYYMKNHNEEKLEEVALLGNNYLQMDFITLKRVEPSFPADIKIDRHFELQATEVPLFQKLSDNTALLRIPSFSHSEKKLIDSVIVANWQTIINTENLILDLRYNGGGSDESYEKLLPIIYTNPIRTVGVEFLSTPLNNSRMMEFVNNPDWSEEGKQWAKTAFDTLNLHIGAFVNLDTTNVSIEILDSIYTYPKNVGILINEGNASTTEQFLLAAKQSNKVKLFGTTTMGILDISNMHFVDAPCKGLTLGYCLSKSLRIPDMMIDNKGIQPDYYMDSTVSEYDWIDFVQRTWSKEY
jgi:hypothetical protein